jgi:deoxyribose-phosphate aldolase
MLKAIKDSGRDVGFKAAGGVKDVLQAQQYLTLASNIMGPNWLNTAHFRFGASSLLASLLATIEEQADARLIKGDY